jgi:small subunit ribosomal protein S6
LATVQPHPRPYELMTVLVPELGDDDLEAQIERISGQIASAGGTINETLRESPWGRRRLAYTIRHNGQDYRDGYYVVTHFTLPPARTTDLERELKLNVQVIRYLLVHDDPKVGERARDPELDVEHSEEADAVQPAEVAATTATVLSDPDAVESDTATPVTEDASADQGAAAAAPDVGAASVPEDSAVTETTLTEEPPDEAQATPPPVSASNADEQDSDEPTTPDQQPEPAEIVEREG